MGFIAANRLWLLAAVAALALAYVVLQLRGRRRYAARFTNLALLASVAPKRPGWRRHVPAVLLLASLVAMVVSLARPTRDERVPRERATVLLAIDVSISMDATDVAPSRLDAARAAATSFAERLPERVNLGLVSFAGTAAGRETPTQGFAVSQPSSRSACCNVAPTTRTTFRIVFGWRPLRDRAATRALTSARLIVASFRRPQPVTRSPSMPRWVRAIDR